MTYSCIEGYTLYNVELVGRATQQLILLTILSMACIEVLP
jgi:hypothetical protein